MAERLFSTTFQLWESQDDALNKVVTEQTKETKGRARFCLNFLIVSLYLKCFNLKIKWVDALRFLALYCND